MAIGDQVGKIAVDEINSTTLPEAGKLISDTLTQLAVIVNGGLNGLEGERQLAMEDLKNTVITPLLEESKAWRAQLSRLCDIAERVSLKP